MEALLIVVLSVIYSSYSLGQDCAPGAVPDAAHFSYSDKDQWNTLYVPACNGTSQSPINIICDDADEYKFDVPLDLSGYNTKITMENLQNNGHTAVVTSDVNIQITGGPAGADSFKLQQFHFHFGTNDYEGSEHQLDGTTFSMEIHLVHMNTKYDSMKTAQQNKDGLLVIAVFADINNYGNNVVDAIAEALKDIEDAEKTTTVDETMNLSDLLPDGGDITSYYTYNGSLTTPSCYEAVIWVVAENSIGVDETQLSSFRNLKDDCGEPIAGNFRSDQGINGRTILYVSTESYY